MAMGLGEVRLDMSGLPEVPLEHGATPDTVKEHCGRARLAKRRARQRETRRWFRNGPRVNGTWADAVALDYRVENVFREALKVHTEDLSARCERLQDIFDELSKVCRRRPCNVQRWQGRSRIRRAL